MKRLIIACLVLPVSAFAQRQTNDYDIKGQMSNLNAPAKVYLQFVVAGKITLDSMVLHQGAFEFKGQAPAEPTGGYLLLNKKGDARANTRDAVQLFVEKGQIMVNGHTDLMSEAVVTGTQNNLDLAAYNRHVKEANILYEANLAKVKAASEQEKNAPAFKAEQAAFNDRFQAASKVYLFSFVKEHPGSKLSEMLLDQIAYSYDYPEVAPLFESMASANKESAWGKSFSTRLEGMKNVALGAVAPEFTLPDSTGKMVSLSSFRGKYVLVDLWASWCGPCRAENPNLVRTYNKYKEQNFTIIGVSLDRPGDKGKWETAIQKDGLTWTQVSDLNFWDSAVAKAYGVHAIPQNFLLDPSGKIIAKSLRGDALNEKLASLLSVSKAKTE